MWKGGTFLFNSSSMSWNIKVVFPALRGLKKDLHLAEV